MAAARLTDSILLTTLKWISLRISCINYPNQGSHRRHSAHNIYFAMTTQKDILMPVNPSTRSTTNIPLLTAYNLHLLFTLHAGSMPLINQRNCDRHVTRLLRTYKTHLLNISPSSHFSLSFIHAPSHQRARSTVISISTTVTCPPCVAIAPITNIVMRVSSRRT